MKTKDAVVGTKVLTSDGPGVIIEDTLNADNKWYAPRYVLVKTEKPSTLFDGQEHNKDTYLYLIRNLKKVQ